MGLRLYQGIAVFFLLTSAFFSANTRAQTPSQERTDTRTETLTGPTTRTEVTTYTGSGTSTYLQAPRGETRGIFTGSVNHRVNLSNNRTGFVYGTHTLTGIVFSPGLAATRDSGISRTATALATDSRTKILSATRTITGVLTGTLSSTVVAPLESSAPLHSSPYRTDRQGHSIEGAE